MSVTWFSGKRLTWNPVYPLPFESGWSVFSKVIAFNNITVNDLVRLIRRDGIKLSQKNWLDFSDSSWIDFDRFGLLLGVDASRLHTGFWDRIGMVPLVPEHYAIRHCPTCWKMGYHCLLFDLARLSVCPWHACKLTEPCTSCAAQHTLSIGGKTNFEHQRYCARCRMSLPNFSVLLTAATPSLHFRNLVQHDCLALLSWWDRGRQTAPEGDKLLRDCLLIGTSKRETHDKSLYVWPLARMESIIGQLPSWKFFDKSVHVRYSYWKDIQTFRLEPRLDITINDEIGKFYRSVRRQIYRRYVRPHRNCFCNLRSFEREQSLALDGESVCIVSLAFLVWRMSIEGLLNIEGLRYARTQQFVLRLMSPTFQQTISAFSRIRWCYFGFFGIWEELTRRCGTTNFRVVSAAEQCEGYVYWKFSTAPLDQAESVTKYGEEKIDCHVLYPDSAPLIAAAAKRCIKRSRTDDMADGNLWASNQDFSWAQSKWDFRGYLFQVRGRRSRTYWHVNV